LSTKVLPRNALDAVKRARPVYTVARRVRFAVGSRLGAREVPGIGRVHYNDFMLDSSNPADVASYRQNAEEIVYQIGDSLAKAGREWESVSAALEVGCGYGRIVRELQKRLPAERIYVSDVIDEGARFTAAEFGVHKMPVAEEAGPEWNERFDLIYLLSVYTHLPEAVIKKHLSRMEALLAPGAVFIFTTHGRGSAENAERYNQYWLDKNNVLARVERDGYYFERYPYYYDEYGLTWLTPPAVERLIAESAPTLAPVSWQPMVVGGHQDLRVWRKP
jgi:SAM-dependent methyltransferase